MRRTNAIQRFFHAKNGGHTAEADGVASCVGRQGWLLTIICVFSRVYTMLVHAREYPEQIVRPSRGKA